MRRSLYFIVPNVTSAEKTLRDLLLARIEVRRIHCLSRRGMRLGNLPDANFLQKTDVIHGAGTGIPVGGFMGVVLGGLLVLFPPGRAALQLGGTMLITTLVGAAFGIWVAGMVGTAIPNSRHAAFQQRISEGEILVMVGVPFTRTREISDLVHLRHPDALFGGTEATIPAFP